MVKFRAVHLSAEEKDVGLRRSTRLTDADLLCVPVGSIMEQAGYRGAINVGKPGFRPGYHLEVKRRSVVVCLLDDREGDDLIRAQEAYAKTVGPLLVRAFGAGRVTPKIIMGVRQGFEVSL